MRDIYKRWISCRRFSKYIYYMYIYMVWDWVDFPLLIMSTWQKACIYPLLYMNHPVPADSIIYNHTLHFPIFIETFTCKYGFLFQSKVFKIIFFFFKFNMAPRELHLFIFFFVILKRLIIIRFHMLIRVHSLHAIHCVCWCEVIIACQLNCFLSGKGGKHSN